MRIVQKKIFFGSLNRNKKGLGFLTAIKIVESFKLIFVMMVGLGLIYLIVSPTSVPPDMKNSLKKDLYKNSLLSNPSCFAYQDANGRTYTYVVDENKLTQSDMDLCLYIPMPDNIRTTRILPSRAYFLASKIEVNSTSWNDATTNSKINTPVFIKDTNGFTKDELSFSVLEAYYD